MANWCNIRLVVLGKEQALARFAQGGRSRSSGIFRRDMLLGEAQRLRTERTRRVRGDLHRKDFIFQVQNDDGLEHFRQVSNRHRTLSFVLVYADPNTGDYGSYCIHAGATRRHRVSEQRIETTMRKHGVRDDDDDDSRFWEATCELMDIAETQWPLTQANRRMEPTRQSSRAVVSFRRG